MSDEKPGIFYGDRSTRMWNEVNAIGDPTMHRAVYGVCCELQVFEGQLRDELAALRDRLSKLEGESDDA